MTNLDLIIGPVYFLVIMAIAYVLRPLFTDHVSRGFFLPALGLRLASAIGLGLLYQFYYVGQGGDTFGYHHGARIIWGYFLESPINAARVIFWDGQYGDGMYRLVSRIPHFGDSASFVVDRVAGLLGLFAFGNYSGIALLFGLLSFSGAWAMYSALKRLYPAHGKLLGIALLFVPSVVFWGSGILKDTITLSALCWMTWASISLFKFRDKKTLSIIVLFVGFLAIFSVKKYILIIFLPALALWMYRTHMQEIRSKLIRWSVSPLLFLLVIFSGFQAAKTVAKDDPRYALNNISRTVYITANDIRYWTGKDAGSGYELGRVPETPAQMVQAFPSAVNVALFRPYLWEVRNPLMLALALESTLFLLLVIFLLIRSNVRIVRLISSDGFLLFALVFVVGFAFAVGISTWNFGTLVRYKVPLMPFFASTVAIILGKVKWDSRSTPPPVRESLNPA